MTKWAIDFDSVLGDFNGHLCTTLNQTFGDDILIDDIDEWNFWTGHEREYFVWGDACFYNEAWTMTIPPVKNAVWAIKELLSYGDHVVVVSDRLNEMKPWLESWLRQYGLDVPVIVTNKDTTKVQIADELGLTHVIDDSPHWCDSYALSDHIEKVYVFDYPYNRGVECTPLGKVERVYSWLNVIQFEL
jgi:hypothetical protein